MRRYFNVLSTSGNPDSYISDCFSVRRSVILTDRRSIDKLVRHSLGLYFIIYKKGTQAISKYVGFLRTYIFRPEL